MSGGPRGTRAPLDLAAIQASLAGAEYTWGRDHELLVTLRVLLAHARALRDVVELGRITLTDNGSFPGKSLDWYRAQALYLRWAPALLAAAQDGPA